MYKIRFNTTNFSNRNNRRHWEDQLKNDFAVAINGKEFECETEQDLSDRLCFIAGYCFYNDEDITRWSQYQKDNDNYINIKYRDGDVDYKLPYGVYGIAQGYIDIDKVINKVNETGFKAIPFGDFYDLRQGNFFKGCFIEIWKE